MILKEECLKRDSLPKMYKQFLVFLCMLTCHAVRHERSSGSALPPDLSEDLSVPKKSRNVLLRRDLHPQRLPTSLIPMEYSIQIDPRGSSNFTGFVSMELLVKSPTSVITFHMNLLTITKPPEVVIHRGNELSIPVEVIAQKYISSRQMHQLYLNRTLDAGVTCLVNIHYNGQMVKNSFGLNEIEFEEKGEKRRILATYLQPAGARKLFPCLDEPQLKSHFTLRVLRHANETAISNMPLNFSTSDSGDPKYFWDVFRRSLKMSTYLVAFVIFDFKNVKVSAKDGKLVRVWARSEVLADTMQAALLASESLTFFEELLGVPYPLNQLDYVALPSYPVPGMENFGLVVSREDAVITNSFLYRKEWISTVISHETAHQWMGNLVTPSWWSEFWLSEGFATYLASVALEKIDPSLEAVNHLLVRETAWVRRSDTGTSSTSLVIRPYDPLRTKLKNIPIYYKGAAILRMMRMVVGAKAFNEGLKIFFKKFQFQSVNQRDFFKVISETMDLSESKRLPASFERIMESWTLQEGYPLITVRQMKNGTFLMSQEKFEKKSPRIRGSRIFSRNKWFIPISYATQANPDFKVEVKTWFPAQSGPMEIITAKAGHWIIMNVQQMVYCRINYDNGIWNQISKQLAVDHLIIPPLNRAQLVEDSLYLFYSGHVNASVPMDILSYLHQEDSLYPWMSALTNLKNIELVLRNQIDYSIFQEFMLAQIIPVLNGMGFSENYLDSHVTKKHRLQLLSWACKMEESTCVGFSMDSFNKWKKDPLNTRHFPEYAAEDYLCAAIRAGDEQDWLFLFKQFIHFQKNNIKFEASRPGEMVDTFMPNALACTTNETIIERYLAAFLLPEYDFTYDDVSLVFNSLARSRLWGKYVWDFLTLNVHELIFRYGNLPVPFILTRADLFHFHRLGDVFIDEPEYFALVQETISENRIYVEKNNRIVESMTSWLRKYKESRHIIHMPQ